MNDSVDPHFRSRFKPCAGKDAASRSEEDVVFDFAAGQMRVRADQDVIAQPRRVPDRSTNHSVLHYDAVRTNLHRPAGRDDYYTEEDPTVNGFFRYTSVFNMH